MRKKIFYLFTGILFICGQAVAQHGSVKFEGRNFPELFMDAKTFGKIVFVEVSNNDQSCKIEQSIFFNSAVASFCNENFICKRIDTNANNSDVFSANIISNTRTTPSFYFFDADRKALLIESGAKTAEEFLQIAKRIQLNAIPGEESTPQQSNQEANEEINTPVIPRSTKIQKKEAPKVNSKLDNYLLLLSDQECLMDTTIYTIIDHEEYIDSKGYKILSNPDSRVNAAVINGSPDLANDMYEAALKIIRKSFSRACATRDRNLFERVLQENNKVMLNKREALRISGKMIEVYNGGFVQN